MADGETADVDSMCCWTGSWLEKIVRSFDLAFFGIHTDMRF